MEMNSEEIKTVETVEAKFAAGEELSLEELEQYLSAL